jgi:hypothetical protein
MKIVLNGRRIQAASPKTSQREPHTGYPPTIVPDRERESFMLGAREGGEENNAVILVNILLSL